MAYSIDQMDNFYSKKLSLTKDQRNSYALSKDDCGFDTSIFTADKKDAATSILSDGKIDADEAADLAKMAKESTDESFKSKILGALTKFASVLTAATGQKVDDSTATTTDSTTGTKTEKKDIEVEVEGWGSTPKDDATKPDGTKRTKANSCLEYIVQNNYNLEPGTAEFEAKLKEVMKANPQIYGTDESKFDVNTIIHTGNKMKLPSVEVPVKEETKTEESKTEETEVTEEKQTELDAKVTKLHAAMDGAGTDEATIKSIISDDTSDEDLVKIMKSYKEKYGVDLIKDIQGDFSGSTENKLIDKMMSALTNVYEAQNPDAKTDKTANSDASNLYEAMEGWGTNESKVDGVLNKDSKDVISAYKAYTKNYGNLLEMIRGDYSGAGEDNNINKIYSAYMNEIK